MHQFPLSGERVGGSPRLRLKSTDHRGFNITKGML
jgi:hypothetical protein